MGENVLDALRYFSEQDRLFKVHFRNVDKPLPHFVETFLDNGYMDMYQVMKVLHESGFRGVAIADHIPQMGDSGRIGTAYSIAYMKAYLQRAVEETKAA